MEKNSKGRKKYRLRKKTLLACVLAAGLIFIAGRICFRAGGNDGRAKTGLAGAGMSFPVPQEADGPQEDAQDRARQEVLEQAERMAASYDYDGAIALLTAAEGYETDSGMQERAAAYGAVKETCVPVSMEEVTHVFYHSLVVDPDRAFSGQDTDPQAAGNNQWMTTIREFEKITQEMYDRGYVIVGIHDLIEETTEIGRAHV